MTGAIGAAMLAMKEMAPGQKTRFKGLDCAKKSYNLKAFECRDCANICEIRKVVMEGEAPALYYGGRCEKYDVKREDAKNNKIPDPLQRERKFSSRLTKANNFPLDAPVIGIPRILTMYEMFPFWKAFFNELGYRVKLSSPTSKDIIRNGIERIVTETCFPIKVSHGHIKELMDKGVKRIFLPSIINAKPAKPGQNFTVLCPYVQSIPYLAKSSFDFEAAGIEVIAPSFHFNQDMADIKKEFFTLDTVLDRDRRAIENALSVAFATQDVFKNRMLKRGKEALAALKENETALVIVGRPYNTADSGINLELPQRLKELDTLPYPWTCFRSRTR